MFSSVSRFLTGFHGSRLFGALLRHLSYTTNPPAAVGNGTAAKPHFMVDYLVASCGFSLAEASKLSKTLSHLDSLDNPDAVLRLLRSHGIDDAYIRKLISARPRWLCCDAEKTLAPKLRAFQDLGFSGVGLAQFIHSNPQALDLNLHRTILPRIEFWSGLIGSTEQLMVLLQKKRFLYVRVDRTVIPNLSLLRGRGFSEKRIAWLLRKNPELVMLKADKFRATVERVEDLGIPGSSGMFPWALWAVCNLSKTMFKTKLDLMKSFGWSEEQFLCAFHRNPMFLTFSEKTLRDKMDFFLKEAECDPSFLALRAELLTYSVEKRLIPRHRVLMALKLRGFCTREYKFSNIIVWPEKKFLEKFIIPYEDKVPGLREMLIAACSRGDAN
ncbi:transcription termination factor MTERF15, mitochondrial [Elaeis guineensis]|uniref:Uncharacterized protein LOC105049092 n=1 Tax=Elaeis guineensis var. tenera TaxID=51953 RepID=A0A6I9RIS3_ELAGV|nr:uncharacterized protein LOC105049092 [Elaeis guineensis]XP_029121567.1 uncharacterized protein LOC105049092 [Elaeis guineensis]